MNNLIKIEDELVPVYVTDKNEKVVYGSDLHRVLEVKSRYNDWVKNRLNDCDAEEKSDYESLTKNLVSGGTSKEYIIKLATAKEMAMLERNDKGKQVRKYFIEVEEKYQKRKADMDELPYEMKMAYMLWENQANIILAQKEQEKRMESIETKVDDMAEIMCTQFGDWKGDINKMQHKIAQASGLGYSDVWNQLYSALETKANCSLKRAQDNKRRRMEKAGNTNTAIKEQTTKLAVIFDNDRIRAIFESIIKEMAVKYCVLTRA